tara:strand:+ start:414 stop:839 length:426 start_codon:yes stop_codon:yes gene_type:complete
MKYTKIENGRRIWDISSGLFLKQIDTYEVSLAHRTSLGATVAERKNIASLAGVLKFVLANELGFNLVTVNSTYHKYNLFDGVGGGVTLYIWLDDSVITLGDYLSTTPSSSYKRVLNILDLFDLIREAWSVRSVQVQGGQQG